MSDEEVNEVNLVEEPSSPTGDAPQTSLLERVKKFRPESILPNALKSRIGTFSRLVACALIVLIIGGVGFGVVVINHNLSQPNQHFKAKVLPFAVVGTTPQNGWGNVTNTHIEMNFNRAVDANSMKGDFWIFPLTPGTFSQTKKTQIIFSPTSKFTEGTQYNVMVHGEFKSADGSPLGADYHFKFTTQTPDHSVIFISGASGTFQSVGSVAVGHEQTYTLSVGSQVDSTGQVGVYKADETALIGSLKDEASKLGDGYNDGLYENRTIDTSNMSLVQTKAGLSTDDPLKLDLPAGVYAIVATAGNAQVGNSWLVVTDLGVALRQDDQKVVLATSSLTSSQAVKADIQLYNFFKSQPVVATSTIDGVGEVPVPYGTEVDWVVAHYNDEFAIAPLNVQYTLADVRVNANLSRATQAFGLTDKPTYSLNEKVNFSGYVVTDNDVHYQLLANRQLKVYVSTDKGGAHLWDSTLTADAKGRVSGSFTVTQALLDAGAQPNDSVDPNGNLPDIVASAKSGNLGIYIEDNSSSVDFISGSQLANFTIIQKISDPPIVTVKFSQASYLPTDTITATVSVANSDGTPLKNGEIFGQIYSQQFQEGQGVTPIPLDNNLGVAVDADSYELSLDAHGHVDIPIDVSTLPAGSSQVITLQSSIENSAFQTLSAGRGSAIIHQGQEVLSFGPTRGVIAPGGSVVSRVYAKTLDGAPVAKAQVQYSLICNSNGTNNDPNIAEGSGTVSTDANGLALITQTIGDVDPTEYTSMTLDVWTGDSENNKVESSFNYYIQAADNPIGHSDLQLSQLDISGAPSTVSLGQTLNLTINSPADVHALVSIDRGRIYKYEAVDLKQGSNSYSVVVTPDMVPSFNLSFSYFSEGKFHVEGQSFTVGPDSRVMDVKIQPDKKSYKAGATASFTISVADATGAPKSAGLIVGIVDEKMYKLNQQPVRDISSFYDPREMTINSTSSLTGRGSGFSGCGGGGNGFGGSSSALNPTGSSIYWNSQSITGSDGTSNFQVKLPEGTWRVFAYSIDQAVDVGNSYIDVTAK